MKAPPKNSKKKDKKKQLGLKKAKAASREENLKAIKDFQLDPKLTNVLISSKTLGKQSLKAHLKTELNKEKLGLGFSQDLLTEKSVDLADFTLPVHEKVKIYTPKKEPESPISSISEEKPEKFPIKSYANQQETPKIPAEPVEIYIPVPIPDLDPYKLMGRPSFPDDQSANPSISPASTLPIIHKEQEIIETIRYNPVTIICGETGSGKSTQLPRFLLENGFTASGKIGITQPRRIAAVTLAQRISQETNLELGKQIGYQVRYDSETASNENLIKFMTDGILLKEIATDFLLTKYRVIIIDEAHERSLNTDILLGLLSRIIKLRKKKSGNNEEGELKLVIMSATLSVKEFTENKNLFEIEPPVVNIDVRQFPVSIHFAKETKTNNYLETCEDKAVKIHKNLPPGGILIFVPGKKEVLILKTALKARLNKSACLILPLYSLLSIKKQLKIFDSALHTDRRLIVIATNVAETSITIPNIVYVIDSGLEKRKVYSKLLQMSKFTTTFISQASANQRSGRAGRTAPGHCYRLYTPAAYNNVFEKFREPDICRSPLSLVILILKALGIKNVSKFPFPTAPNETSMNESLKSLEDLSLLKPCRKGTGDIYEITELGKEISNLPINPRYGKMLVYGKSMKVDRFVSVLVAGMETEQIFDCKYGENSKENLKVLKKSQAKWFSRWSDFSCVLAMFRKSLTESDLSQFCENEYIVEKSLREIQKLTIQLYNLINPDKKLELLGFSLPNPSNNEEILIQKSIVCGFIDQIAMRAYSNSGQDLTNYVPYTIQQPIDLAIYSEEYKEECKNVEHVFIHPSSYFFNRSPPDLIAYQHLIFVKKPCLVNITEVKIEWLYEFGEQFVKNLKIVDNSEGVYDEKNDCLKSWVTGNYGKKLWPLPMSLAKFPDCDLKFFHFAKLFMEGKIIQNELIPTWWKAKPSKFSSKQMIRIMASLKASKVSSARELAEKVWENPEFLVKDLIKASKEENKEEVASIWKTIGLT